MREMEILRELFDEKIIRVLNTFLDNQEKNLSLSEISELSKINMTTTFRIIKKLAEKDFINIIIVGKTKTYQIKRNEKVLILLKFLKKDTDYLLEFINNIKQHLGVKKIVLELRSKDSAKLLIVGDIIPSEKIKEIAGEIKTKHNFAIDFVEISEKQFAEMKNLGLYDLNRKIIWERKE